jgi:RHS repeat-associated protein
MEADSQAPYGYKGQWGYYTDMKTGLLLLTHRYFDPATGRFLTRDPVGFDGGINLYAYVGNGVVMGSDPAGCSCAPVVYICSRDIHLWDGSPGWLDPIEGHQFFWIHYPCNPKRDETIGYGPPGAKPPQQPDDKDAIRRGDAICRRTTCSAACIKQKGQEIRGGAPWDPRDYKIWNPHRNCRGFVNEALSECRCGFDPKSSRWGFSPEPGKFFVQAR